MKIEHFCEELVENLKMFEQNMKKENAKPQSFPEWYNMFGRWLEVGTEMEQEYWGDDDEN